jgi:hypothetical protein
VPDTVVVDESIQIYGVVIHINSQNFHHLKMVEILITSGLPDGVNYAGEYKRGTGKSRRDYEKARSLQGSHETASFFSGVSAAGSALRDGGVEK